MWLAVVTAVLVSYMLGNLNGAVCISALMNDDVRSHGSGNAGLTNFVRNFGAGRGLLVILIDASKAVLACLASGLLLEPYFGYLTGVAAGGTAVMLGHVFPALLGFRGGKGVLSGLFIALMTDWRIALMILAVFAVAYLLTQYVSLGSVLAAITFGVGYGVFHYDTLPVMLCGIFMSLLVVYMHRANILRLIRGEERKTNLFKRGDRK
jgi:glycerol-3-phosphate acyltransferase PlsY